MRTGLSVEAAFFVITLVIPVKVTLSSWNSPFLVIPEFSQKISGTASTVLLTQEVCLR